MDITPYIGAVVPVVITVGGMCAVSTFAQGLITAVRIK